MIQHAAGAGPLINKINRTSKVANDDIYSSEKSS